ncbi:putative heterokaryon incompatibility [Phaeomoniella chlamydospora]|uniref:Putative heterokaryon incompatibility n=1 Tax=Phaeomoniella chlamydospora TaxID=158046 RepID=A0A0G2E0J5_PHACM|nr:putative heterokaryon incompatibility [Phaeomoniella chlamydospora]
MEDDSQVSLDLNAETYGPGIALQMSHISQYRITRSNAYAWAQELTFIVYDDEVDQKLEEQCRSKVTDDSPSTSFVDKDGEDLQAAIKMCLMNDLDTPPQSDEQDINEAGFRAINDASGSMLSHHEKDPKLDTGGGLIATSPVVDVIQPSSTPSRATSVQNDGEPSTAESIVPEFPPGQPKKFKLIRSRSDDFLAVSYCWPKDHLGNPSYAPRTYSFRRMNEFGNYEEAVCTPHDEAVDRAVQFARENGIRMIWIDQVCLPQDESYDHQLGIQAMDFVYQRAKFAIGLYESTLREQRLLDAIFYVLNLAAHGTQPQIQSDVLARDLIDALRFLIGDQWNTRGWILQEAFASRHKMTMLIKTKLDHHDARPSTIFSFTQGLDTFFFQLTAMEMLIQFSRLFLVRVVSGVIPSSGIYSLETLEQEIRGLMASINQNYPKRGRSASLLNKFHMVGGSDFGPRDTCNAAVAISLLRNRKSYPPQDRLAILANLCDYDVRLDTREVRRFPSLGVAYFALALINGDFSLLNPDAYSSSLLQGMFAYGLPRRVWWSNNILGPVHQYQWMPPFRTILPSIVGNCLRTGVTIAVRTSKMYQIYGHGLKCPAYLWRVDRKIDFTPLQEKVAAAWNTLYSHQVTVGRFEDETDQEYKDRSVDVSDYLKLQPQQIHQSNNDEYLLSQNVRIRKFLNVPPIENDVRVRTFVSKIYLDILRYLYVIGENGVANAIWQSMRMDAIEKNNQRGEIEIPDDVGALFNNEELLQNSNELFQFDFGLHAFHQAWIVDRIINVGYLWVARWVPSAFREPEIPPPAKGSDQDIDHDRVMKRKEWLGRSTLNRAMLRQMLAHMVRVVQGDQKDKKVNSTWTITTGPLVEFVLAMQYTPEENELKDQVAVFDVDGSTKESHVSQDLIIATPRDSDTERLPHPAERAMRVCWVVDSMKVDPETIRHEDWDTATTGEKNLTEVGGVDKGKGVDREETTFPGRFCPMERYKVKGKVRGFWPLMEHGPTHEYLFI